MHRYCHIVRKNVYNKQSKETEAPLIVECALNMSAAKCIEMEKQRVKIVRYISTSLALKD